MLHSSRASVLVSTFAALTAVLTVTVYSGCGSGTKNIREASTISAVDGLAQFDAMDYYALWSGDVSLDGLPQRILGKNDWEHLVEEKSRVGLEQMASADRETLLQGAVKAYLTSVQSTERVLTLDTDQGKTAIVGEWYQRDNGLFALVAARDEQSTGIITSWADVVTEESGTHHSIEVYSKSGPTSVELREYREDVNGGFYCESDDVSASIGFLQAFYYLELRGIVTARPVRSETRGGRASFVLQYNDGPFSGGTVEIDSESLFPVAYTLPVIGSMPSKAPRATVNVTITAINHGEVMK